MTQHDAKRIEQAAYMMLHVVVTAGFGSEHAKAGKKYVPPGSGEGDVSLHAARQLLEGTSGWTAAATEH